MKKALIIAINTFREMIREKLVLVIVALVFFLLCLSLLFGELTFNEQERMMADMGFAAIEIAAVAIALFSGATLLSKEIERQTCLLVLAKPVSRQTFLFGKGLGLNFLVTTLVAVLILFLALLLGKASLLPSLGIVALSIWCKAFILLGWALFSSVWIRPILSILSGVSLYLLGHWLTDLAFFAKEAKKNLEVLFDILRWVVPNFDRFNWKSHYFLLNPPPASQVAGMLVHTFAWVVFFLWVGGISFNRRDIV